MFVFFGLTGAIGLHVAQCRIFAASVVQSLYCNGNVASYQENNNKGTVTGTVEFTSLFKTFLKNKRKPVSPKFKLCVVKRKQIKPYLTSNRLMATSAVNVVAFCRIHAGPN